MFIIVSPCKWIPGKTKLIQAIFIFMEAERTDISIRRSRKINFQNGKQKVFSRPELDVLLIHISLGRSDFVTTITCGSYHDINMPKTLYSHLQMLIINSDTKVEKPIKCITVCSGIVRFHLTGRCDQNM